MRIKIIAGGIYDATGEEVPVGTEFDVKDAPEAWTGRYETISGDGKGKVVVTNDMLKAVHHGGGKFNIVKGDEVLASGMSKEDADAFNGLSEEDKTAYVEAAK